MSFTFSGIIICKDGSIARKLRPSQGAEAKKPASTSGAPTKMYKDWVVQCIIGGGAKSGLAHPKVYKSTPLGILQPNELF